ncbi:2-keto-4-pentenoate hydratase [Microlunatus soli]|uniref:2-keto-4-pentenoate hydratase n=1 Tax=Microlunatus soli TaxID=630515 RepID=A0A1H1N0U5_9ACTN|nr:hypothetical protein [Microlunatus soli]SDR92614.1 2-keto-4-pentenoate hydratase [Microlunatus soli]
MDITLPARAFVEARRSAAGLPDYPGPLPVDLEQAYAIQDAAITLWLDEKAPGEGSNVDGPAGWKAGLIAPDRRTPGGDERLIGPIWADSVAPSGADPVSMPVYADGFAAVEAEFVIRLDAAAEPATWTADDAAALPQTIFAGIEIASSPLKTINDLGPAVTASDFGNNAGLVIGPEIPAGTEPATIAVSTEIDGRRVGDATGAAVPGGIHTSLAQTLTILGRRGRSVPGGTYFATGAVTGVHVAAAGQSAVIRFGDLPELRCLLQPAAPR